MIIDGLWIVILVRTFFSIVIIVFGLYCGCELCILLLGVELVYGVGACYGINIMRE